VETHSKQQTDDIFVSYAREDEEFVHRLARDLREVGYGVWTDTSAIVGGQDWMKEIQQAIDACRCVVVAVSPSSVSSEYVNIECRYAIERRAAYKCIILPILVEPMSELPMMLRIYQAITSFPGSYEQGFKDMLIALKRQGIEPAVLKSARFFGEDLSQLRELFGTSSSKTIQSILPFMADRFSPLFTLGDDHVRHPLFREIGDYLDRQIPQVSLRDEDGKLMRINVRHVLLRQETLQLLLGAISPAQLNETGKKIGESAAGDLLKNTVESRYFPSSAVAFVNLWSYWDRIGGMGVISLIEPSHETAHDYWDIRIDNNFLHAAEAQHHLCMFWSGYIHGFLSTTLRRMCDLMYLIERDREQELSLVLPVFQRVRSVEHTASGDSGSDIFRVTFESDAYSEARQLVNEGRRYLMADKDGLLPAAKACRESLQAAHAVQGGSVDSFVADLAASSEEEKKIAREILGDVIPAKRQEVAKWLDVAVTIIQQLAPTK
jgi:hypothetical protein